MSAAVSLDQLVPLGGTMVSGVAAPDSTLPSSWDRGVSSRSGGVVARGPFWSVKFSKSVSPYASALPRVVFGDECISPLVSSGSDSLSGASSGLMWNALSTWTNCTTWSLSFISLLLTV